MSCCGRHRAITAALPGPGLAPRIVQPRRDDDVAFEYVGRTGLTVRGPASGIVYRFPRTGSRAFVRAKDSVAIAALPQLQRVSR